MDDLRYSGSGTEIVNRFMQLLPADSVPSSFTFTFAFCIANSTYRFLPSAEPMS